MANPRGNYKAKWLAALGQLEEPDTVSVESRNKLRDGTLVATDAALEFRKIQTVTFEAAKAGKALVETLDEFQKVAGLDFGETLHEIDGKIGKMPVPILIRRLRDLLRIANMRIGLLSTAAIENHKVVIQLRDAIAACSPNTTTLDRTLKEVAWIGPQPSQSELEDFVATNGNFARDELVYNDLDEDWFDTRLGNVAKLRIRTSDESDDGEENTDSEDEPEVNALVRNENARHKRNRSAQVIPTELEF